METTFYLCKHCGNIIMMIRDCGVPVVCCGEKMKRIEPGIEEASHEKHVPVYKVSGHKVTVTVGSTEHPMEPDHYIEWICIQSKQGMQQKQLKPNTPTKACFALCEDDEVISVYAFCNKHSLWKAQSRS